MSDHGSKCQGYLRPKKVLEQNGTYAQNSKTFVYLFGTYAIGQILADLKLIHINERMFNLSASLDLGT